MRIAFLTRITVEHGVAGGMEQHGRSLCEGLTARGHQVVTITTAHPAGQVETFGSAGRSLFVAAPSGRYSRAWDRFSTETLMREHGRAPFDVMISQSAGAQALINLARHRLGLATVVILHGTLGSEWRTRRRDVATPLGALRAARFLLSVPSQARRWQQVRGHVAGWLAVSTAVGQAWQREMRLPTGSVRVVHNGVDTARFRPDGRAGPAICAALDVAEGTPLLVAAGRLEREKGYQIVIEALRHMRLRERSPVLIIAGAGRERAALERLAERHGVAARFLGQVPNSELPPLLAAADLFVLPSLRDEGFPVSVIEAMACGVAVLASRTGGVPEAVVDGVNGRLLPMGDVAAWARAIDELLEDKRRRRAMGALARQTAEGRFSKEAMVAGVEQVVADAAGFAFPLNVER